MPIKVQKAYKAYNIYIGPEKNIYSSPNNEAVKIQRKERWLKIAGEKGQVRNITIDLKESHPTS